MRSINNAQALTRVGGIPFSKQAMDLIKRVAPELLINEDTFVEKFNSPEQTAANLQPHQIQDTSLNRNKRQLMDKLRELGYEVD